MAVTFSRRAFLKTSGLGILSLSLGTLRLDKSAHGQVSATAAIPDYRGWEDLYREQWRWDRIARSTHYVNCWYQSSCNWNVYVKDGIAWREEQASVYEATNAEVPDFNPRGCQKGACYSNRMYDPTRLRYPLKRAGERGEGRWQRISWDEALAQIADTLIDTLEAEGPAAIQIDTGTQISWGGPQGIATTRTARLLDAPVWDVSSDLGDDHQGVAVTCGKIVFCGSADDMFCAEVILIWGGNPVYTQIPNAHFLNEARYRGATVITICPDYNASSIHADLWIPVRIGTDAALALALAQVIVSEHLHNAAFLKEQTDMPLLVRDDTHLLLRAADLEDGGASDSFFAYDTKSRKAVPMRKDTLALGDIDPALEGEFEVPTRTGNVKVRPVFALLQAKLEAYTPEKAAKICGTSSDAIRDLGRRIGKARSVTNVTQSNFSKFYHGMEMERAQLLVFALCGHFGKKGSGFQAFPWLLADAAESAFAYPNMPLPQGRQAVDAAMAPMLSALAQQGLTEEMIAYEVVREQAYRQKSFVNSVLTLYLHGGLKDLTGDQRKWDPGMKRDIDDYIKLALEKEWVYADTETPPKVILSVGGNMLRRIRGFPRLVETLLPKLRLLVDFNWRLSNTGRYADIILPVAAWYEQSDIRYATPLTPYLHGGGKAVDPAGESMSAWKSHCLLARKLQERAASRGVNSFRDRQGRTRRLDTIYDDLTYGGNYRENDDEKLAEDFVKVSDNLEGSTWNDLKDRGFTRFSKVGKGQASVGNATDLRAGETFIANTRHTDKKQPWPTLTRRMQFYIDHELFLELGEELPVHKEETIGGNHPLRMTGGHTRHSIHASWRDHALMMRLQRGEPVAYMNPSDAEPRGIADHDMARVFNDVGSFQIRVKLAETVSPGQFIVYHAWEPYMFRGGNCQQTITPSPLNPVELAGQYFHLRPMLGVCPPGQNDRGVRVDVEKAGPLSPAPGLRSSVGR
ncbi:MAG: molybdopterin-dependent oxidoreductase [Deltaproteobacteria bacterium]|nr:molybdopterin-dependent oxidoreductase [Deltaproteobacteria bacterium]